MTKRILAFLLTLCMVIGLIPCIALAADTRTVTVIADTGGKVSTDGISWSDSVTATIPVGEKIGDYIKYRADEGYMLDSITSSANITAVSAGQHFTVIIDDNGQVYTAGDNGYGKRAIGDPLTLATSSSSTWFFAKPTNGIDGSNIKAIAAGKNHTVVLDGNGDVYTTGSNNSGQLGRDISDALKAAFPNLASSITLESAFYKVNVGDGSVKIKAIAASKEYNINSSNKVGHTVLVDENGKIWTAGGNTFYQLGRKLTGTSKFDAKFEQVEGDVNNVEIVAVAAGEVQTIALDSNGHVWITGDEYNGANGLNGSRSRVFTQCSVDGNAKITAIAAGSNHSVLLDENGNVYTTGLNSSGQLGLGDNTKRKVFTKVSLPEGVKIVSIAAGAYHTILVAEDGKVYSAGKNDYGQLGLPLETDKANTFTSVTINGIGEHKIVSAAAGEDHTVLLDDAGRIWTAGNTYSNQGLCRILKPYKAKDPDFALAMSSPVLMESINNLSDFTVTGSHTITISFKEKEKVNVTYNIGTGSWVSGFTPPTFYYKGDSFTPPALTNLVREGYNATSWTITSQTDTAVTYRANWEEKNGYTVKYDTNGGTAIADKTDVKWNDEVLEGIANPTRTGYIFDGWTFEGADVYNDEHGSPSYSELVDNDSVMSITLTARWTQMSNFTVTFDANGGSAISDKTNVRWTDKVLDGVSNPTRNGYNFAGWKYGDIAVTDSSTYADLAVSDTVAAVTLTAQWLDVAVPTGEIKIAGNGWKTFLNNITFGLFFKETQTVTITAADNSGETVKVEYLLSNKELTEAELAGKGFMAYSAPFTIDPDNEYVIYAKLTDTSGNTAYINTEGIVLDATVPVISGIENGKTYCAAQTVTVAEKYIDAVTVNGKAVTLDSNHSFTLNPADGTQTIVVTDKAGNKTTFTVTVNDGHTYEWLSENGQYWQKCKFCGVETARKDIPSISINGADKVCRTQDYKFSFTLPEGMTDATYGYEFIGVGVNMLTPTIENGLYSGMIESSAYPAEENSFKLTVRATAADGFVFSAEKTVVIQNEHTGGTATCKDKAKCEVCGESYGELDANNHSDLKHFPAVAATKTSEGNIEYWYCEGCGKYFAGKDATKEITKADTVTAKLPEGKPTSPTTGDTSNLAMWIAIILLSGSVGILITVVSWKKKRSVK